MGVATETFLRVFERFCPTTLAEAGDPIGFQIGNPTKDLKKIMVCLDVRPEVVAEAIEQEVDLLVAKHPPIFRPVKQLSTSDPQTKMYQQLLIHDIGVYVAHTNLDIIEGGLNDWFCEELGIIETNYLEKTHQIDCFELHLVVPAHQANEVQHSLEAVGAFDSYLIERTPSTKKMAEVVLITYFYEPHRSQILSRVADIFSTTPPIYTIYPLAQKQKSFGLGRVGRLANPLPLQEFAEQVKQTFNVAGLRLITTTPKKMIERVAICGGSGEKFYPAALAQNADVYITGDVYYHTAHDMLAAGLSVIDPGHHIEVLCQPRLLDLFNDWKKVYNWEVEFSQSRVDTNPFRFV